VSMPDAQYNYSYVLPGGQITLTAVFQTTVWSGVEQPVSGVQITIAPAAGGPPVVGPASDGITTVDQATYTYQWLPPVTTPAGDYTVTWTAATPTGIAPITLGVTVVALPQETPSPGVYATVQQYRDETGDQLTPADRVTRLLRKASRTIDRALIGAVYPIDADDMPTTPAHIDLFMRATCEQCLFMAGNNDDAYLKSQYSTVSMDGVSQTRTARAQGQVLPPLAPAAAEILQTDGALAAAPLVNW
jgi:hypothetical protein